MLRMDCKTFCRWNPWLKGRVCGRDLVHHDDPSLALHHRALRTRCFTRAVSQQDGDSPLLLLLINTYAPWLCIWPEVCWPGRAAAAFLPHHVGHPEPLWGDVRERVCALPIRLSSGPKRRYSQTSPSSKFTWTHCSNLWAQPTASGRSCLPGGTDRPAAPGPGLALGAGPPGDPSLQRSRHLPRATWHGEASTWEPGSDPRSWLRWRHLRWSPAAGLEAAPPRL